MIVFGQVKLAGGMDLSKNFSFDPGRHLVSRFQRQPFLCFVMVENGSLILPGPGT